MSHERHSPSAPIACSTPSDGSLDGHGGLMTPAAGVLEGICVTPIFQRHSSSQSVDLLPRNVYSRSVPCPVASPRAGGFPFMENLRRRTRQRSINIPATPDFGLSEDLGFPPILEPPPDGFAGSAPDGGCGSAFSTFRQRSETVHGGTMTPRRQSGVLVFFPSSASIAASAAAAAAAAATSSTITLTPPSERAQDAGDPSMPTPARVHTAPGRTGGHLPPPPPHIGTAARRDAHSQSFDGPYNGHLPSLFSPSSTSSSSSTSENHTAGANSNGHGKVSPRRPLYVDTALANEEAIIGTPSDVNRRRSTMAHVVDFVRGGGGTRVRTSSLTSPSLPQPISARASCSAEMSNSPLRSPSVRGPCSRPPLYRYSRQPQQQRSLDSGLDLTSPVSLGSMYGTALLIKEASFFSSFDSTVFGGAEISTVVLDNQDAVYSLFMKAHKCYDLIPVSTKLVVFDIQLPVKKAFYALVYNGVRAAPLWDSERQQFVGMLTITDFIKILYSHHEAGDSGEKMAQLEEQEIATWRKRFAEDGPLRPLVCIDPNESLYRAVQLLCESHVHRLPVLDRATGNISYILTHKRIIKFLSLYLRDLPRPAFMDETPRSLGIGSWGNVLSIHVDTKLIDALKIFLENRVSALPLVDEQGKVVDIYAKFDVIALAAQNLYDKLEITVRDALKHRQDWFEGVHTCKVTDSLFSVLETAVQTEVHRLIVVDEAERVVGIVSLSDILKHLVLDRCVERSSSLSSPQAAPVTVSGSVDGSSSSAASSASALLNGIGGSLAEEEMETEEAEEREMAVFDVVEEEEASPPPQTALVQS